MSTRPTLVATATRIPHAQADGLAHLFARRAHRLAEDDGPCLHPDAHQGLKTLAARQEPPAR